MADDSDVMRSALRGLRRDSLRAQRRREPALMVSIGLADPEEEREDEEMEEGDESEETDPAGYAHLNTNDRVSKAPDTDPEQRRRRRGY